MTLNNNDTIFDELELQQIDMFVCREMKRQVHRYTKAMSGSKNMMMLFEEKLSTMSDKEQQEAIAKYIDLNRRVIDGIDWKIIAARALSNYCETFSYLLELINDKRRMVWLLQHIKDTYVRFHEVIEVNGKFGIKDYNGNVVIPAEYDFLRSPYVYVDDMRELPVIAEKNGKLGLIKPDGKNTIVAPFEYDDISLRSEPPFFEVAKGGKKMLMNYKGEVQ